MGFLPKQSVNANSSSEDDASSVKSADDAATYDKFEKYTDFHLNEPLGPLPG